MIDMDKTTSSYLAWDSDFFNLKIGRIHCDSGGTDRVPELVRTMREEGYDLVYIEVPVAGNEIPLIAGISDKPVDLKIVYGRDVAPGAAVDPHIREIDEPCDTLRRLGIQAGHRSRFTNDRNFRPGDAERFYRTWVDNSFGAGMADHVLVYVEDDRIKGMVTLKIREGYGDIGLLAVDEGCRGEGIGRKLMSAAAVFTAGHGMGQLRVATQADNPGACRFYEYCGCRPLSRTAIYHKWLNVPFHK